MDRAGANRERALIEVEPAGAGNPRHGPSLRRSRRLETHGEIMMPLRIMANAG